MAEETPRPPIRHDRRGAVDGPVKKGIIDYPRAGKRGLWRWIPSWRLLLGLFMFCVVSVCTVIGVAFARTPVPTVAKITEAQTSIVYYDDGHTEIGRFQVQNRVILQDKQIPPHLKDAVIAAEDRTFWTNKGISPRGIARAAWNDLHGRSLQGGSTLTQQYVKNVLLNTQERTYKRKFKELAIAIKVANDNELGKTKILDTYLNTIYFGRNSYGVEAASQAYFHKHASKVTLSEAAFLAGIINGPELYDPQDGEEQAAAAEARWNYVLDSMVTIGKLTPEERAAQKFPRVASVRARNSLAGQRGYLMDIAGREVKRLTGYTDNQLATLGLRITTTFNKKMIDAAVEAVKTQMPDDAPKNVSVGLATVDPNTGAVKSLYGGKDYLKRAYNASTQGAAQAGSSFKPFALVTALEQGIGLKSTFDGRSPQTFDGYEVSNFPGEHFGMIDLVEATKHSVNTVYVALNKEVGPENTVATAVKAGLPRQGLEENLANVLGTATVTPVDMASAYSTFAAQGVRHERYYIQRVAFPGRTIYTPKNEAKRVFAKDVMADATYAMQAVVKGGTGTYVRNLGRPAAGKTGTTSGNKAAWFVGFTPQYATSVALYREGKDKKTGKAYQQELGSWGGKDQITGGSFPAMIWTEYMKTILDGKKVIDFPEPAWIGGKISSETSSTSTPTETRSPDHSPSPSRGENTPTPTDTPKPTKTKEPKPTLEPTPTETAEPSPTPSQGGKDPGSSPSPSP